MMIGSGCCTGFGQPRRVGDAVHLAAVGERLADGVFHSPSMIASWSVEVVEARRRVGEVEAVGGVLGLVPAGADAELDPTAAHLVDLGDADGQQPGAAERDRGDERAEADASTCRGPVRPSVTHASVGPGRPLDAAHLEVVVAAEEAAEAERLGALGDGQQRVVGRALLGLGEDAQVGKLHARTVAGCLCRRQATIDW